MGKNLLPSSEVSVKKEVSEVSYVA
jgi:hypothetical protein